VVFIEIISFFSDIYETITVMDHWPSAQLYNELKEIDHEEFRDFTNEFCERLTFVAIIRGNVVTETAAGLAEFMEEKFPLTLGVMEDFQVRMLELPLGDRIVRLKSYSEYGGDSHVTNFYQIGAADAKSRLCAVFVQVRVYSGVSPNMSGTTIHLELSRFWISASFRHKLPCSGYARIQKKMRGQGVGLLLTCKE